MRLLATAALFGAMAGGQCAMCFRTAEAQTRARAEALNRGIFVLWVPLAASGGAVAWLAYRRRARTI